MRSKRHRQTAGRTTLLILSLSGCARRFLTCRPNGCLPVTLDYLQRMPKSYTQMDTLSHADKSLRGTSILYLDENPLNRNLTDALLRELGADTRTAETVPDFLNSLSTRRVDAALLDQATLDHFAESWDLARRDPLLRDLPLLIVGSDPERATSQGAANFLPSPLEVQRLIDLLEKTRNEHRNKDEERIIGRDALLSKVGGKTEEAIELLQTFIDEYERQIQGLHEAEQSGHSETMFVMLRSLRSVASAVGADRLYRIAGELQGRKEEGQNADTAELGACLNATIKGARDLIAELEHSGPRKRRTDRSETRSGHQDNPNPWTSGNQESEKPAILTIDDSASVRAFISENLSDEYQVLTASSGADGILMALDHPRPRVILTDVTMPGMDGYETCRRLKEDPRTRSIPVIFLTSRASEADEERGLSLGAADYIRKPFSLPILKARIRSQSELVSYRQYLEVLIEERTRALMETQREVVFRLAQAAEYRDNDTGAHIKRLGYYAMSLAEALGFPRSQADLLYYASFMHDVGKIGIPDQILLKPGKLNDEEWRIMKTHTQIGARLLEGHSSELLRMAAKVALTHHERWDGTGYPTGLAGADIPLEGRIVAICDVFDALLSERPYKRAWTYDETLDEINRLSNTQFDPQVVHCFNDLFAEFVNINEGLRD